MSVWANHWISQDNCLACDILRKGRQLCLCSLQQVARSKSPVNWGNWTSCMDSQGCFANLLQTYKVMGNALISQKKKKKKNKSHAYSSCLPCGLHTMVTFDQDYLIIVMFCLIEFDGSRRIRVHVILNDGLKKANILAYVNTYLESGISLWLTRIM